MISNPTGAAAMDSFTFMNKTAWNKINGSSVRDFFSQDTWEEIGSDQHCHVQFNSWHDGEAVKCSPDMWGGKTGTDIEELSRMIDAGLSSPCTNLGTVPAKDTRSAPALAERREVERASVASFLWKEIQKMFRPRDYEWRRDRTCSPDPEPCVGGWVSAPLKNVRKRQAPEEVYDAVIEGWVQFQHHLTRASTLAEIRARGRMFEERLKRCYDIWQGDDGGARWEK